MPFGEEHIEDGVGLSLSGGGYRAVLFHTGALWRINELGVLSQLSRVSSVSGGAIVAGLLAVRWPKLVFDGHNIATNFVDEVVTPLRTFCSSGIDVASIIGGTFNPFRTIGEQVAHEYRERLGLGVRLCDLAEQPGAPGQPRFVFNSTNYATGSSFRFSQPYAGDYRLGLIPHPTFDVATAVACSSAFPPVLAPIELDVDPQMFEQTKGADLWEHKDFRRRLPLADGGVYDNLGLETVWKRFTTVLVSDAGKPFEVDAGIGSLAPKQILRVMDIALNQALALRKRVIIDAFKHGQRGSYWGIDTPIADYRTDSLAVRPEKIRELSAIRTRLDRFQESEQCELINWGYAVCDAALHSHAPQLIKVQAPHAWPYERFGLA